MTDEVDTKRQRPDVAERRNANRKTNETCVKSCLRSAICGKKTFKDKFVAACDGRTTAYSKRIYLASIKVMGLVKEHFANVRDEDLAGYDFPVDIFDTTNIRHMMLGTGGANVVDNNVSTYLKAHPQLSPGIPRHTGDSNIYTYGATQYVTVLRNSLWMNLESRIKRFLKAMGYKDDQYVGMLYRICGWVVPPSRSYFETYAMSTIVDSHRRILGLTNDEVDDVKVGKSWLKNSDNQMNILKYYVMLNRWYARRNLPTFNITPIFVKKRHFCTVDTTVLHGIMKDVGKADCNLETFVADGDVRWKKVLNISRLEGGTNTFTGTIQTDGIGIVTHFRRPKNVQDTHTNTVMKNLSQDVIATTRIVAVDPGRSNIFYGVEEDRNDPKKVHTYVLSRAQYYAEAGMTNANTQTKAWQRGIACVFKEMSRVSSKGADLEEHARYVDSEIKHRDAVWSENFKKRWSRQRMRLYGGKKRVFARFFNRIQNRDEAFPVTIVYGSAKFAPGGRGEVSVPTSRMYKECCYRFPTVAMDEFRTTKIFAEDDSLLHQVQHRKDRRTNRAIRGLLWSTTKSKFVNRDKNAALNILRCATSTQRPKILSRAPSNKPLRQKIVKWIRDYE